MNAFRSGETRLLGVLLVLSCLSYGMATITLNSTVEVASPGEMVTYTCTVTEAGDISWTAAPIFIRHSQVRFLATASPDQRMRSCNDVSSINCTDIDFQAALTSVGALDMNNFANLTSTFTFNATAELNGTVVECRGETNSGILTLSQTLTVEAPAATTDTPTTTVMTSTTPEGTVATGTGARMYEPLWAVVLTAFGVLALMKE